MVIRDHDKPASDKEETEDKAKEAGNCDSFENKLKSDLVPPTQLERLKEFSQKVVRCAAKSFCETYVHPIILQNPSLAPNKIATSAVINQNHDGQISVPFYPTSENEGQAETLLNPRQEKEAYQTESAINLRDNEKENHQTRMILDLKEEEKDSGQTVKILSPKKEEQKAVVQEPKKAIITKPQSLFDIGGILFYLPHGLAASDVEDEPAEPSDVDN